MPKHQQESEVTSAARPSARSDATVRLAAGDQEAAIRRVQRLVAQHVPAEVSLVDELLAERRREAAREADET